MEKNPPKKAAIPKINIGSGFQVCAKWMRNGEIVEPTLADIEQQPRATFLMTVGNCSTENKYMVP